MRYQETWIKGQSTGEGFQRECAPRYDRIRGFLEQFKRPFSVFDFGANMGYFTFRIAEDFPHATVIAVDKHQELADLAAENGLPNVVAIPRRMDGEDLSRLATCEHVDVVLALNVLHHMDDWQSGLEGLRHLSRWVIVETPGRGDTGATGYERHAGIMRAVRALPGSEIHRSKAHTSDAERIMFLLDGEPGSLTAQTLDAGDRGAPDMVTHSIEVDFERAELSTPRGRRGFVPGINLWNTVLMEAQWPRDLKARVIAEIDRMASEGRWHDDLRPWNFILSGGRAVAIDYGNKTWRTQPEPDGLTKCLAMIDTGACSTSRTA